MMNEPLHVSDDRLIDLVNHLLSPEEEKLALAHIEACVSCEARFRTVLLDHETAKSLQNPSARTDGKGVISLPRRPPRRLGAVALIAAAAVVALGMVYFSSRRAGPEAYWIPLAFDSSSLRAADSISNGSSAAFHAYDQRDAQKTIELLRAAPPVDDEMLSSLQRLVLASALVNDHQPREALDVLDKLEIFSLPVRWREQAQWVEYLALRDVGRDDDARARLEKLAGYEGDIGDRARAERTRRSGN
jgi:hypothetical protein